MKLFVFLLSKLLHYNMYIKQLLCRETLKPRPEGVVLGLIAVNVAVFMLWQNADPGFMMENFMVQVQFFYNLLLCIHILHPSTRTI